MKKRVNNYSRVGYIISLFLTDFSAYITAVVLAFFTRIMAEKVFSIIELQFGFGYFILDLWWVFAVLILMFISNGLYVKKLPFWLEARDVFKSNIIAFIVVFAFVSILKSTDEISRLMVVLIFTYSVILMIMFRYIYKKIIYKDGNFNDNTIIIGGGTEYQSILKMFNEEKNLALNIKGQVLMKEGNNTDKDILGIVDDVERIVKENNITVAIIIQSSVERDALSSLMGRLHISLSKIILLPSSEGLALSNAVTVETLMNKLSYLEIKNNIESYINRVLKRSIDLFLCILSLPFIIPFFAIMALAIMITSKGKPFYTHARIGRNGRTINVIKFRSMYIDAKERLEVILRDDADARVEWESSYKLKNDPRVTKIGNFLRKSSLDELPQIINVIVGDMSLVGPRPVIKEEIDKYYKEFATYYTCVRPGITGLWQVSGRSDTDYDYRISRDTWYVLNWSVWLDLTILFLTPTVVIKRKGAY